MADQPPEPTELVSLQTPSWLPAFTALGITLTIVGLFAWWPYAAVGAVIALASIYRWIRSTADEVARLPRRQRTATSPIPLTPSPRRSADES